LIPLLAVLAWLSGHTRKSIVSACVVLLPLVIAVEAYESWNFYRTGTRFVSTTAQFNMPLALEKAAKSNPAVIAGDTPFDRTARSTFSFGNLMDDMGRFDQAMFKEGYNAVDQSKLAFRQYFASWQHYPIAMLAVLRGHISEKATKFTIRPIATICDLFDWAADTPDHCYDYRDLVHGVRSLFSGMPWTAPMSFIALTIEQTCAIVLFSGFFLGIPALIVWRAVNGPGADASMLIVASFWLMYVGWFLGYGIVHYEDRFMMPMLPVSIVGGLFCFQQAFARVSSEPRRDGQPLPIRKAANF
jgi:hypothetical protein